MLGASQIRLTYQLESTPLFPQAILIGIGKALLSGSATAANGQSFPSQPECPLPPLEDRRPGSDVSGT